MTEPSSPPPAPTSPRPASHDWRRPALEMGPLGVFFAVYMLGGTERGLIPATVALMIATVIALALSWRIFHRLPVMPVVSAVVVLIFGTLTLIFNDDGFIMMKPTIVNVLFGATLLGGLAFGRSFLQVAFDAAFDLDAEGWRKLTLRWGLFFFFLAAVNEVLRQLVLSGALAQSRWVTFKVFGVMPITFVFALTQVRLIQRHTIEPPATPEA